LSEESETRRRRRRPRRRSRGGGGGQRAEGGGQTGDQGGGDGGDRPRRSGGGEDGGRQKASGGANQRSGGRGRQRQRNSTGRGRQQRQRKTGRNTRRPRRDRSYNHWWARRWSEVLENFEVGRRLGRGRSYARQGQVLELDIDKGSATAMVQGSRDAPYLVRMHFSMLSSTDWKKVIKVLGEDPELGGRLLMSELPEGIEAAFESIGLSLFPAAGGDLKAACSCPDQANPCKHVAAVYYTLGEEFDREPFLLFKIRGMDRSELIEALARTPAARAAIVAPPKPPPPPEPRLDSADEFDDEDLDDDNEPPESDIDEAALTEKLEKHEVHQRRRPTEEPLSMDPHEFWAGEEGPQADRASVRVPATPGALARRLGGFVFWRGEGSCGAVMEQVYRGASSVGLDVYLGESGRETSSDA
jgi:uncharacterized Zn finger protein